MTTQTQDKTASKSKLDQFSAAPPMAQAVIPAGGSSLMGPGAPIVAQRVHVHRDEQRVMDKLKVLAAAAGDEWGYRFPVKNNRTGQTTYVEGPSIKLATTLARVYGNCEVDCRVTDLGDEWIIYARFSDLETGFTLTRPFQQRKAQQSMGKDDGRQQDIALQIGASKAIRNVIVNALREFADFAHEEAQNSLVTKIGSRLPEWRVKVAERLNAEGVDILRAERVVGRALTEWTAPDVAKVVALAKAVSDGMSTWNDAFPVLAAEGGAKTEAKTDAKLADFAEGKAEKPAADEGEGDAEADLPSD
jgi:hypothetical protein